MPHTLLLLTEHFAQLAKIQLSDLFIYLFIQIIKKWWEKWPDEVCRVKSCQV